MSMRAAAASAALRPGLSSLPRAPFPPPELRNAILKTSGSSKLTPEIWGTLQAPSPTALSALSSRLKLSFPSTNSSTSSNHSSSTVPMTELLDQALTHSSCLPLYKKYYPNAPLPQTNQTLASVGNGLLGLFASEWVHATYPHLPNRVVKAAVSAYVGPRTLADLAKEWGALPLLRWSRTERTSVDDPLTLQIAALSSFPRALIALIAQHISLADARQFTQDHFLTRSVDLEPLLKFRSPKIALVETVAKFGRERPVSRLLKETGRYTNTPMFVVGIYSGSDKLGEGFGHSLKMAEYRAAEDGLIRIYLTKQPCHLFDLPTTTFPETFQIGLSAHETQSILGNSWRNTASSEASESRPLSYRVPDLGESEVLYASAGRTGTGFFSRSSLHSKESSSRKEENL